MKVCFIILCMLAMASASGLHSQSVPPLVNYQGRLTDASGAALPAGNYGVAFRLWDRPSTMDGQTLVWGQEYDVSLIEGGVFNVILGAPGGRALTDGPAPAVNDLAFAFGQSNRFLGLTLTRDATGRAAPTPKELVPRQQILSTPFAFEAGRAAAVTTNAVVQTVNLAEGSVTLSKLQARPSGTNVPVGGIAVSLPVNYQKLTATAFEAISTLEVTIQTTGRPVVIFLAPPVLTDYSANPSDTQYSGLYFITAGGADLGRLRVLRNNGEAAITTTFGSGAGGSQSVGYPTMLGPLVDFPPPGTHTYTLQWGFASVRGDQHALIMNQVLVAFEL